MKIEIFKYGYNFECETILAFLKWNVLGVSDGIVKIKVSDDSSNIKYSGGIGRPFVVLHFNTEIYTVLGFDELYKLFNEKAWRLL